MPPAKSPTSAPSDASFFARVVLSAFFLYLGTFVIEGPVRYVLAATGLGAALYLRDLLALGLVGAVIVRGLLTRGWLEREPAIVLSILTLHLAVSLVATHSIAQTLFGFKIFIPLILGASLFPLLRDQWVRVSRAMGLVLVISLAGVFLNRVVGAFPWEGMAYDTGFGSVETTRQWWTFGGQSRLPGFARGSFDAAIVIGLSGMVTLLAVRSLLLRLIIIAACLWAIWLTTTKGMILAFGIFVVWNLLRPWSGSRSLGAALMLGAAALGLLVPALILGFDLAAAFDWRAAPDGLASLFDRFNDMWPRALRLMTTPLAPLVGQGLGSIGAAQAYIGEQEPILNAADNIFIYLYVTFGLLGIGYAVALATQAVRRRFESDPWSDYRIGMLLMTFTYGLTTSVLESAVFLGLLGLTVGDVIGRRTRQLRPQASWTVSTKPGARATSPFAAKVGGHDRLPNSAEPAE